MLRPDLRSELVGLVCLGVGVGRKVERHERLSDPRRRHGGLELYIRLRRPAAVHPLQPGLRPGTNIESSGGRHAFARCASKDAHVGRADRHGRVDGRR